MVIPFGRYGLFVWPMWSWPIWFVADIVVADNGLWPIWYRPVECIVDVTRSSAVAARLLALSQSMTENFLGKIRLCENLLVKRLLCM